MLARVTSELKFHRSASRMHSEQPVKTPAYSTAVTPLFCSSPISPSCRCPARPPPPPPLPSPLGLRWPCAAPPAEPGCCATGRGKMPVSRQTDRRPSAVGRGVTEQPEARRTAGPQAARPGPALPRHAQPSAQPGTAIPGQRPAPGRRTAALRTGPKDRPAASPASQQPGPPRWSSVVARAPSGAAVPARRGWEKYPRRPPASSC